MRWIYQQQNRQKEGDRQRGFTILFAVIVLTLIVSIAGSIMSVAMREIKISTSGRNSVVARYAAESGRECVLFWYVQDAAAYGGSESLTPNCGNSVAISTQGGGYCRNGLRYEYMTEVDFGLGGCATVYLNSDDGSYRADGFDSCSDPSTQRSIVKAPTGPGSTCGGGP